MLCVGTLLVASPAFDPELTDRALLEGAAVALSQDDPTGARVLLFGWATRAARSGPPPGLEALGREALVRAARVPRLRVFASRRADGLSVGVTDPARLVGHVEVYAELPEGRVRLPERPSFLPGRRRFAIPRDAGPIIVQAISDRLGQPLVVAEARISAPVERPQVPSGPDPPVWGSDLLDSGPPGPEGIPPAAARDAPWWWWLAGAVAAGLLGAAVWQETR